MSCRTPKGDRMAFLRSIRENVFPTFFEETRVSRDVVLPDVFID